MTAAACDVPLPRKNASPMRAAGNSSSSVEPGTRSETTPVPGAAKSGGRTASRDEKSATVSSAGSARVLRVGGADRDQERIGGGQVEPARAVGLVAGRGDDRDAALPQLLGGVGERLAHVGAARVDAEARG